MFYLQFIRIQRGLSQAKLAKRTGVVQPTISDFERGRKNPTDAEIQALASALAVTPVDLMKLVDVKPLGDAAAFKDAMQEMRERRAGAR